MKRIKMWVFLALCIAVVGIIWAANRDNTPAEIRRILAIPTDRMTDADVIAIIDAVPDEMIGSDSDVMRTIRQHVSYYLRTLEPEHVCNLLRPIVTDPNRPVGRYFGSDYTDSLAAYLRDTYRQPNPTGNSFNDAIRILDQYRQVGDEDDKDLLEEMWTQLQCRGARDMAFLIRAGHDQYAFERLEAGASRNDPFAHFPGGLGYLRTYFDDLEDLDNETWSRLYDEVIALLVQHRPDDYAQFLDDAFRMTKIRDDVKLWDYFANVAERFRTSDLSSDQIKEIKTALTMDTNKRLYDRLLQAAASSPAPKDTLSTPYAFAFLWDEATLQQCFQTDAAHFVPVDPKPNTYFVYVGEGTPQYNDGHTNPIDKKEMIEQVSLLSGGRLRFVNNPNEASIVFLYTSGYRFAGRYTSSIRKGLISGYHSFFAFQSDAFTQGSVALGADIQGHEGGTLPTWRVENLAQAEEIALDDGSFYKPFSGMNFEGTAFKQFIQETMAAFGSE